MRLKKNWLHVKKSKFRYFQILSGCIDILTVLQMYKVNHRYSYTDEEESSCWEKRRNVTIKYRQMKTLIKCACFQKKSLHTGWARRYRKYILQTTQPSQYGYVKLQYRFAVTSGTPSRVDLTDVEVRTQLHGGASSHG